MAELNGCIFLIEDNDLWKNCDNMQGKVSADIKKLSMMR